jgi:hypothetical protein
VWEGGRLGIRTLDLLCVKHSTSHLPSISLLGQFLKEVITPRLVRRVCIIGPQKYAIVNSNDMEFTGADAKKGIHRSRHPW